MRGFLVLVLLAGLAIGAGPARADDPADVCEPWAAEQALPYLLQAYAYTPYGLAGIGWGPLLQAPAAPFSPGPWGPANLLGPPGLVPAYGPAGPATAVPGLGSTVASFGNTVISALNAPPAGGNLAGAAAGAAQAAAAAGQELALPLPPFLPGGLINLARPSLNANGNAVNAAPAAEAAAQFLTFEVTLNTAHVQQSQLYGLNQRYLASGHAQLALAMQRNGAAQAAQNTFDDAKAACQAHLAAATAGTAPEAAPSAPAQSPGP
jgi:hypothetical protein